MISDINRILIIKLGALGDVLRTTCILPGLKHKYKTAHISWLTDPSAECLLKYNGLIDELLFCREGETPPSALRSHFDLVINLEDGLWACELSSSVKASKRVGAYSENSNRVYTRDSQIWFDMSLISRHGKTIADQLKRANQRTYPSLLFEILEIPSGKSSIIIPASERLAAFNFAKKHSLDTDLVIGINTGSGARWRYKQLGEEKTVQLIDRLASRFKCKILLLGGAAEVERNARIRELAASEVIETDYTHSPLEFAAVIALCDTLISSDSLALHIATSLGVPVIAFFGPTSEAEIELFSGGAKISANIPCARCYKKDCNVKTTCMDLIDLTQIEDSLADLLKSAITSNRV